MIQHVIFVLQDIRSGELLGAYEHRWLATNERNSRAAKEHGLENWVEHLNEEYKIIDLVLHNE